MNPEMMGGAGGAGIMIPGGGVQEEIKEQFYRKDPTFHNLTTINAYQGGSVETILYLSNRHIAISGSSQQNKLVICEKKDIGPSAEFAVIAEFGDHMSTITGLLEFNGRLVSCGIDKNIVTYDIIKKQPISSSRPKSTGSIWSCFTTSKNKQSKGEGAGKVDFHYSYVKHNVILNAHNSQINCSANINDQYFATGASKEVKIWKFYECVHVIPNAHSNAILSLKVMKFQN